MTCDTNRSARRLILIVICGACDIFLNEPFARSTEATQIAQSSKPAYQSRGEITEQLYASYTKKLAEAHQLLMTTLRRDAPDLYKKLNPAPPKPVPYGYQILPELTREAAPQERRELPRATSTPYSWSRTDFFIQGELPRLATLEEQLKAVQKSPSRERRSVYERAAAEYPVLEANQRLVDNHIQYNHFWQKTIAEDKPRFDRLTRLHDAVLERQSILDSKIQTPQMIEREKALASMIQEQNQNVRPASCIKVEHPKPTVWILRVPVYTDITDAGYLRRMKAAIERIWYVEEKAETYKVLIDLRRFAPTPRPKRGEHIDARVHVARFPLDGGVITTGVNSTYAIPGRYVALGPQPMSHNVLAHEFGHILGYVDGYFRGYRDLGGEGFEVLEVVPDPDDIMCTPGVGHVRKHHFTKILERLKESPSSSR